MEMVPLPYYQYPTSLVLVQQVIAVIDHPYLLSHDINLGCCKIEGAGAAAAAAAAASGGTCIDAATAAALASGCGLGMSNSHYSHSEFSLKIIRSIFSSLSFHYYNYQHGKFDF